MEYTPLANGVTMPMMGFSVFQMGAARGCRPS